MTTLSDFSDELANAIAQAAPMIVTLPSGRFAISGVHWRSGLVVTTVDAVRCKRDMTLMTPEGALSATVVGTDPGTDLAVLRVDAPDLPTAELGDLDTLRVGHLVLALGRSDDGNIRASCGILASLGGEWQSWTGGRIDRLIRPDIRPFPGFSGSPLLDTRGRVLGINTTHSRGRFAITIPITTVNRVVDQLVQHGRITQGYLGVGLQPVELTTQLKQSLNLTQEVGVLIVSVEADSPADRAGVLIGDILLTLGGEAIANVQALRSQLRSEQVGQPITAQMIRGGQLVELTLTIGER
ncbi:trypsin-like peptidase domain-containing protein [Leptolyngbya sp. FACHB-541]|uniref:S1C family serine protease n=1 Tax=Leptolyngbya sp. FACHB-541 TaxID=2692810 RepID=UPI0016861FD2|nr:trypsin-like peptidase domain-containing protein [Leptolyngbya sp. FACHB-541]MBD1997708.1 trypsin-like peptidase domain-containing protein [Leptolyngbya sp. FACHB-541]